MQSSQSNRTSVLRKEKALFRLPAVWSDTKVKLLEKDFQQSEKGEELEDDMMQSYFSDNPSNNHLDSRIIEWPCEEKARVMGYIARKQQQFTTSNPAVLAPIKANRYGLTELKGGNLSLAHIGELYETRGAFQSWVDQIVNKNIEPLDFAERPEQSKQKEVDYLKRVSRNPNETQEGSLILELQQQILQRPVNNLQVKKDSRFQSRKASETLYCSPEQKKCVRAQIKIRDEKSNNIQQIRKICESPVGFMRYKKEQALLHDFPILNLVGSPTKLTKLEMKPPHSTLNSLTSISPNRVSAFQTIDQLVGNVFGMLDEKSSERESPINLSKQRHRKGVFMHTFERRIDFLNRAGSHLVRKSCQQIEENIENGKSPKRAQVNRRGKELQDLLQRQFQDVEIQQKEKGLQSSEDGSPQRVVMTGKKQSCDDEVFRLSDIHQNTRSPSNKERERVSYFQSPVKLQNYNLRSDGGQSNNETNCKSDQEYLNSPYLVSAEKDQPSLEWMQSSDRSLKKVSISVAQRQRRNSGYGNTMKGKSTPASRTGYHQLSLSSVEPGRGELGRSRVGSPVKSSNHSFNIITQDQRASECKKREVQSAVKEITEKIEEAFKAEGRFEGRYLLSRFYQGLNTLIDYELRSKHCTDDRIRVLKGKQKQLKEVERQISNTLLMNESLETSSRLILELSSTYKNSLENLDFFMQIADQYGFPELNSSLIMLKMKQNEFREGRKAESQARDLYFKDLLDPNNPQNQIVEIRTAHVKKVKQLIEMQRKRKAISFA